MDRRERDGFEDLPILADLRELLAAHMRETAATAPGHAAGTPTRARRRTGWALAGLRRAPLALAVAVALAVVAVGLVALHQRTAAHHASAQSGHGSQPPASAEPPPAVVPGEINHARKQVIAHDPACAQTTNHGQTIDRGSPPESMLSVLGVLRRPPLSPDPTDRVLHSIGWDAGAGVYVNYLRRARTEYGRSYWLVPEARTSPFAPIPARCDAELRATLKRDLRHASAARRTQALRALDAQLSAERAQSQHRQGLCFVEIGLHTRPHPGAVGFGCSAVPAQGNPLVDGNRSGDRGGGTIQSGVVADGYVSVSVHFPAAGGAPALTLSSDVVNNVYVLKVPRRPGRASFPDQWRLRRADGGVLTIGSVVPPPTVVPVQRTHGVRTGGGGGGG